MTGRIGLESSPPTAGLRLRALVAALALAYPACLAGQGPPQANSAASPAASAQKADPHLQAAITVEGGGTLGAYEGGLTWALVEVFRQRRTLATSRAAKGPVYSRLPVIDFRAAAGASAGSINAFLAANRWCAIDAPDTAEKSTFWKAWVPTGINQLLPGRKRIGDRKEKGILSRVLLDSIFSDLDRTWKKARYDPACSLTFGASITRLARDSLRLSSQVHARNQRYGSAFTIKGAPDSGKAPVYLRPPVHTNSRVRLGMLVELPVAESGDTIPHAFAFNLIKASSGYPLVFEPYRVRYCPMDTTALTQISTTRGCTPKSSVVSYFVDGGVFDNGPLTLAYGLALADSSNLSLNDLHMLFITPNQRRNTGGRWDAFGEAPALGAPTDERASEGLDALMRVLETFIPSARQYEMQIAARLLPSIQQADINRAILGDSVRGAELRAEQQSRKAALEHDLRVQEWRQGLTASDSLKYRRDSIRYVLAVCRRSAGATGQPDSACGRAADDSIIAASPPPAFTPDLSATPPAPAAAPDTATLIDPITGTRVHLDSLLFVTKRYHPLGGDWLAGFGGMIGRPLREYDFYVGIYDGFALLSEKFLCWKSPDPTCVSRELEALVKYPPIPLTHTAGLVISALFDAEFLSNSPRPRLATPAVTRRDSVLLYVVKAMAERMTSTPLADAYCRQTGPIERFTCAQGMDSVFHALRDSPNFTDLLYAPEDCLTKKMEETECAADERFVEFVENPPAALNRLAGDALARVSGTTPKGSSMQMPLTLANAMYFATNERARQDWDRGSVSLPTNMSWLPAVAFSLVPSSVGGFIGIPGWYTEWAARYHVSPPLALGVAVRTVWRSGFRRQSAVSRGRHFIPSFRPEWKFGGTLAPWVSTVGLDIAYWSDWEMDQLFPKNMRETGMSVGVTSALLVEKVRISWQTRPGKYAIRTGEKPVSFVSIGLGDASGTAYWIGRVVKQKLGW